MVVTVTPTYTEKCMGLCKWENEKQSCSTMYDASRTRQNAIKLFNVSTLLRPCVTVDDMPCCTIISCRIVCILVAGVHNYNEREV